MATKKTFEDSINELEEIVQKLEKGECPLDETVKLFEKGVKISTECHKTLNEAEQKIRILTETDTKGDVEEE